MKQATDQYQIGRHKTVIAPHHRHTQHFFTCLRHIESACFQRRPYQFRMTARFARRPRTGSLRTERANARKAEHPATALLFQFQQATLQPLPLGQEQRSRLLERNPFVGFYFDSDKECRPIAGNCSVDIIVIRRTRPALSKIAALTTTFKKAGHITKTRHIVGHRK